MNWPTFDAVPLSRLAECAENASIGVVRSGRLMAGAILAMMLAVTAPAEAGEWHRADAAPMAWRVERGAVASGERVCRVLSQHRHVTVSFAAVAGAQPAVTVEVGFDNTPGSLRYLRINREVFQTDRSRFDGAVAADIVRRLAASGEFAVEWEKGPRWTRHHGLYSTGDFAAKADACRHWLRGEPA
jgi:hypothetical protein